MNKLRDRRGFTLTELLCAVLIVLLVSALLTVGVRFAGRTYNSSMQLSEAQELCSTLTSVISDKLRFCGTVTPRRGRQPGPHLHSGSGQRGGRGRRLSCGCRRPAHPGQHQTAQQRRLSPGSSGPRCQSALRQCFGHLYRDPSGGHCRQHPGRDLLRGPALKSHMKKQHLPVLLFSSRFHEKKHPRRGAFSHFLKLSFSDTLRLNTMCAAELSRLSRQK